MKKLLIIFPLLCTLSSSPMNKANRVTNLVAGAVTGSAAESMDSDAYKFALSTASFALLNHNANNLQELIVRAILFYGTHSSGYYTKEKQKKVWNKFLTWYKEKYRKQPSNAKQ